MVLDALFSDPETTSVLLDGARRIIAWLQEQMIEPLGQCFVSCKVLAAIHDLEFMPSSLTDRHVRVHLVLGTHTDPVIEVLFEGDRAIRLDTNMITRPTEQASKRR